MLSENLRLHEALAKLDAKDVRVQAALAATQANWHASRQAWPEAVAAFDRLVAADPTGPEALAAHARAASPGDGPVASGSACRRGHAVARRRKTPHPGWASGRYQGQVRFGFLRGRRGRRRSASPGWTPNSPASRSNLLSGDVIVKVNGVELTNETMPNSKRCSRGSSGRRFA